MVQSEQAVPQTPGLSFRQKRRQPIQVDTGRPSPSRAAASIPRTPTTPRPKEGLRGLYQDQRSTEHTSRPSSSYKSPTTSKLLRQPGTRTVIAPQRDSSRFAQTSSSEKLRTSSSEALRSDNKAPTEYQKSLPPPVPMTVAEDLMTEPDSQKWWKDVREVRSTTNGQLADLVNSQRGPPPSNFLFNAAEDEEQFIKKANSYLHKRR